MANDLDNPGVLMLDTAAVISTTNLFAIRKIVLIAGATACDAEIRDGADRIIAQLAAPAESSDEIDFNAEKWICTGLELQSIAGTGAVVYVYCG
jgi:hypothetical protein